jgi:hypothetical protein
MIKYRINGEYLDLFSDLKDFAITKQISKIGEIDSRHGDFSTAFKVPLTANNARILRYTPELNNNTDVGQFRRYDGQLVEDEAVISDGYYQVTKFSPTKKEVEIKFFGGNSDWFDLLKDRYINDNTDNYNFDDLRHKFNFDGVTNSFNNTDGYIYFPFDNVKNDIQGKGKGNITIDLFNVGVFVKDIFQKIFDSIDIKIKGTLFNDPQYYQEILPSNITLEDFKNGDYNLGFSTSGGAQIPKDGSYIGIGYFTGNNDPQWNGNTLTANSDADNITFRLSFQTLRGKFYEPNYGDIQVRVRKNGAADDIRTLTVSSGYPKSVSGSGFGSVPSGEAKAFNYDEEVYSFGSVLQGDTFSFEVTNINNTAPPTDGFYFTQGSIFGISAYLNAGLTNAINEYDISLVIPRIKQTDFIKDIMIRYGVVSQYDIKTKTLTLNKFEDIDNNRVNAPDWTSKIDLSKQINVDFTKILSGYAKSSLFEYVNDSSNDSQIAAFNTVLPYNLGTGVINIDNDFLSDEKTVYKSPFAPTASIRPTDSNDGFYLPYMPIWQIDDEDDSGNIRYTNKDIEPRVLLSNGLTSVFSINQGGETTISIIDDSGTPQDFTDIGYAFFAKLQATRLGLNDNGLDSNTQTLNFENYELLSNNFTGIPLLERNYQFYNKILNAPFYVSLYMNLTALDVQQLDFFTPIFLEYKYDSGYYYIDSVEQYKGDGSTTKVNLVKI